MMFYVYIRLSNLLEKILNEIDSLKRQILIIINFSEQNITFIYNTGLYCTYFAILIMS